MSACPELRVLFRAAAGSRRGFGHLVRCRSLARALGVRPLICLRGPQAAMDVALALGCDIVAGTAARLIRELRPDVVVVDDPVSSTAARWIAAARAAGVPVASVHDLGLGCLDADLVIDGSVARGAAPAGRRTAVGPRFAIVDPTRVAPRPCCVRRGVVIALGGGPRAHVACAIARAIARRVPEMTVRVVGGFISAAPPRGKADRLPRNLTWTGPVTSLIAEFGRAQVAVVAGGVSLYEACALGAAPVAVPVVAAQRATVTAFVREGAAVGSLHATAAEQVAEAAVALLTDARSRRLVIRRALRLVGGQGTPPAAREVTRLVAGR
jgi:UDP-2,4-diacetamido-2,4,6-trideoxy-beta-L-altropyranose hydrolase